MARVKRGVTAHKRHKRLLNASEGRKGTNRKLVKRARESQLHALAYEQITASADALLRVLREVASQPH